MSSRYDNSVSAATERNSSDDDSSDRGRQLECSGSIGQLTGAVPDAFPLSHDKNCLQQVTSPVKQFDSGASLPRRCKHSHQDACLPHLSTTSSVSSSSLSSSLSSLSSLASPSSRSPSSTTTSTPTSYRSNINNSSNNYYNNNNNLIDPFSSHFPVAASLPLSQRSTSSTTTTTTSNTRLPQQRQTSTTSAVVNCPVKSTVQNPKGAVPDDPSPSPIRINRLLHTASPSSATCPKVPESLPPPTGPLPQISGPLQLLPSNLSNRYGGGCPRSSDTPSHSKDSVPFVMTFTGSGIKALSISDICCINSHGTASIASSEMNKKTTTASAPTDNPFMAPPRDIRFVAVAASNSSQQFVPLRRRRRRPVDSRPWWEMSRKATTTTATMTMHHHHAKKAFGDFDPLIDPLTRGNGTGFNLVARRRLRRHMTRVRQALQLLADAERSVIMSSIIAHHTTTNANHQASSPLVHRENATDGQSRRP